MKSQADLIYMGTLQSHNWSRGKFSTHLVNSIWYGLLDSMRSERDKPKTTSSEKALNSLQDRPHPVFDVPEFLGELTEDAKTVAKVALESPSEMIGICATRKGAVRARGLLFDYFERLGWTLSRIAESFSEIGRVLE